MYVETIKHDRHLASDDLQIIVMPLPREGQVKDFRQPNRQTRAVVTLL